MSTCPCSCHTGVYAACDVPGGCGHLHPEQAPTATRERPAGACLTHLPPKQGHPWRRADDGYLTCSHCYDQLHKWLSPLGADADGNPDNLPYLYVSLNPKPSNTDTGRRAPGFGSRSPAADHVIAMRDVRDASSAPALLRSWVLWTWDERYDNTALNEPDYRQRRSELPTTVTDCAVWLDRQLDWLTRHEIITDFHAELKELRRTLRIKIGLGGQRPVGHCIEILETGECRTPIFMPKDAPPRAPDEPIITLPELRCPNCDSSYTGRRLILLRLAEERAANHVKAVAGAGDPAP